MLLGCSRQLSYPFNSQSFPAVRPLMNDFHGHWKSFLTFGVLYSYAMSLIHKNGHISWSNLGSFPPFDPSIGQSHRTWDLSWTTYKKKPFVWYICHAQCLLMGDIAPLVHFLEMLACHISVCWSCIFATTKCPASFAMACQTVWVWSAIACHMLYCSPDLEGSCMVYGTALEDWTHCLLLPPSWSRFDKGLMFELWTFFSIN